jgi:ABC-type polysaccharide/polyol phosphate transport system ATPase subunit
MQRCRRAPNRGGTPAGRAANDVDLEHSVRGRVTMSNPGPLVITGLQKSFGGVQALRGASLTCKPSEVHALIGENGAGKSKFV